MNIGNVLSLFDGYSGAQAALNRAGIEYDKYYASEVDKYAIQVTQKNYSDTVQLGDVRGVRACDLPKIDLVVGGSPCQGFSFAGKQMNFDDPRSKLFFEYVRILKEVRESNPDVKFMLENVKMKKEYRDVISNTLGIEPILINSALVSAQKRERLYWCNWNVEQPKDRGILLKDVVFDDACFSYLRPRGNNPGGIRAVDGKAGTVSACSWGHIPSLLLSKKALEYMDRKVKDGRTHWDIHHSDVRNKKSVTIVANFFKGIPYNVLKDWNCIRMFHPIEVERLQTLADNYTEGVSKTQRFKMLGNGFNIDTIAHVLKGVKR